VSEWTTDLRQAQPGWLVEQDCVGVDPAGQVYEITKGGVVLSCDERVFRARLATPLGDDEVWVLSYTDTKVRVRASDATE
jgi:hypothetical protein